MPTHHRPQVGRANPLYARLEHTEDLLSEAGWLRADPATEDLLRVPDIAAELGLAVTTIRRKLAAGQLQGRKVPDPSGGEQWAATRADVEAYRRQLTSPSTLSRIAEEYEVDYHTALRTLRRLCSDLPHASGGRLPLTTEHEAALRAELDRLARLDRRSLRLGAAARKLSIGERTLRRLLADGALDRDPETDGTGTTYVTRSSLARLQAARDGRPSDPTVLDSLSVADLAILADLTPAQVTQLVRAGHLEPSIDSARPEITWASVHRWAFGYRPDLLEVLGVEAPSPPVRP